MRLVRMRSMRRRHSVNDVAFGASNEATRISSTALAIIWSRSSSTAATCALRPLLHLAAVGLVHGLCETVIHRLVSVGHRAVDEHVRLRCRTPALTVDLAVL